MSVDPEAKCMTVLYTADGYPDMLIGASLPWDGEPLLALVEMYAPIANWLNINRPVAVVEVGTTGVVTPPVLSSQKLPNESMWDEIEFENKVARVLTKFKVLESDPTAIAVTKL